MSKETLAICNQVKMALDGRTQRWLSMKAQIPESDLSKKMKDGKFTPAEISAINKLLKSKIKLKEVLEDGK